MALKALEPDCEIDYDSDEDLVQARLPLLRNQVSQPHIADSSLSVENKFWNVSSRDKK